MTSSIATENRRQTKLTDAQLAELEQELRSERNRLERTMRTQQHDDEHSDIENAMQAPVRLAATAVGGDARLVARHQAVSDALARIESDEYGICTNCNEPIPFGRLLAMPETTRCIACGRAA